MESVQFKDFFQQELDKVRNNLHLQKCEKNLISSDFDVSLKRATVKLRCCLSI